MALGFGMLGLGMGVALFATVALFLLGKFELGMKDEDEASTD